MSLLNLFKSKQKVDQLSFVLISPYLSFSLLMHTLYCTKDILDTAAGNAFVKEYIFSFQHRTYLFLSTFVENVTFVF